MSIELLCEAIENKNINAIESFINKKYDLNTAHSITNLLPIEYAVKTNNLAIIQLLVDSGASLIRNAERKKTHHNLVIFYIIQINTAYTSNENLFIPWLLEPPQLKILQQENISLEHLHAISGRAKMSEERLDIQDCDGLSPMYYAALIGSEELRTWIPDDLQNDFPHVVINDGLYKNTTGAWWLSFTNSSISLLRDEFDCLNSLNLAAEPYSQLVEKRSLISKLSTREPGLEWLVYMSDKQFTSIDWKTKVYHVSLALQFLLKPEIFIRIFSLPLSKLETIDWNQKAFNTNETLAARANHYNRRGIYLYNLPAEILNTIDWEALATQCTGKLINNIAEMEDSTLEDAKSNSKSLQLLLPKLSNSTLTSLINNSDLSQNAHIFLVIELLDRLIKDINFATIVYSEFTKKIVENNLAEISKLFSVMNPDTSSRNRKIDIIKRFAKSEHWANILLQMAAPFYPQLEILDDIESPIQKLTILAQHYELEENPLNENLSDFFHETLTSYLNVSVDVDKGYLLIALELLKRLSLELKYHLITFTEAEKGLVVDRLATITELFLLFEPSLSKKFKLEKKVNSLKGQIINCFTVSELWANTLLNMKNPFYQSFPVLDRIKNSTSKLKVLGQHYEMQGNKSTRYLGTLFTVHLILENEAINEVKVGYNLNY